MVLANGHWRELETQRYKLALLPWGATEPHNRHLPYGTDSLCSEKISTLVAEQCAKSGVDVVALPPIPYGVNTGQRDLNLCISIRPSVQYALLREIALAMVESGVEKLMIINGHGGNNFKPLLRELSQDVPNLFACFANWWTVVNAASFFDEPGDHAGELETSVMLHLFPETVLPLAEAGTGTEKGFRTKGLKDGLVWAPRHWRSISEDTGVGNPAHAKEEKGERFVKACVDELVDVVLEFSTQSNSSLYD